MAPSQAADGSSPLSFAVDGSLPLGYSSNPGHDVSGPTSGYLFSPFLQLSASGSFSADAAYLFYMNTTLDKSLTKSASDADESQNAFGATLQQRWGDFSIHVGAERNYFYDGIYSGFDSTANDFAIGLRYRYTSADGNFRLRPLASYTARVDDNFELIRNSYNFKIDIEQRLSGPWWLTITPRVRFQDYHKDVNEGRRDIVSSISLGVRYAFNRNLSLTTGVAYENRSSNRPDHKFDDFMIGTSLDFSFGFNGPDWIYERASRGNDHAPGR